MNAIAFSLYGDNPRYCVGAVRNAELAKVFYPGWLPMFYADDTVPPETKDQLRKRDATLIECEDLGFKFKMFWRFLVHDDPAVDRYIIRDADSRLNMREVEAVREWVNSGRSFHSMRDHPHHAMPVMGGMWGATKNAPIGSMAALLESWKDKDGYGTDQTFLAQVLWPLVKGDCLQHDSCTAQHFPGSINFPSPMQWGDWRFVGEVFDSNDQPRVNDWEMRINAYA